MDIKKSTKNNPLDKTSLSILKKDEKWYIVRIMYNEGGDVGPMELIHQEDKYTAIYNFKIEAGEKVMPE